MNQTDIALCKCASFIRTNWNSTNVPSVQGKAVLRMYTDAYLPRTAFSRLDRIIYNIFYIIDKNM